MMALLGSAKIDVNRVTQYGKTALEMAVCERSVDACRILVKDGRSRPPGIVAIKKAVKANALDILEILLSMPNFDFYVQDERGVCF
jgi:hypothetical protein